MLLSAPQKLLFSADLIPPARPPSTSCTAPTRIFSPVSSSTLPYDPTGGDDLTTTSKKSKLDSIGGALRGSDILLAMQKAVAHKEGGGSLGQTTVRKGKKRRQSKSRNDMEQNLPNDYDYSSVRPIEISSDWGSQIDEFERRIQELRSRHQC